MNLDLEDPTGQRGANGPPINFDLELVDLSLCRCDDPFVDVHVEATIRQVHDADGSALAQALPDIEQILDLSQPCLGLFDLGVRDYELSLQVAVIDLEKQVPALDAIAPFHRDCRHDSGHRCSNRDVLAAGFDDAGAGYSGRKRRYYGIDDRGRAGWRPIAEHDGGDRKADADDSQERKDNSGHSDDPGFALLVTSVIFPSSICAILSANWKIRGSCVTTMSARSCFLPAPRSISITASPVS